MTLGGEVDEVTAGITLGVLRVEESNSVEWLVDVSKIVDEESEGVGFCLILTLGVSSHALVNKAVLVA